MFCPCCGSPDIIRHESGMWVCYEYESHNPKGPALFETPVGPWEELFEMATGNPKSLPGDVPVHVPGTSHVAGINPVEET